MLQHFYTADKPGRHSKFYNAIRKYGRDAFTIELLRNDAENYKELLAQEVEAIENFNTRLNGYNSTAGGQYSTGKEIEVDGKWFPTLVAAAEYFGIDPNLAALRLRKLNYSPEQAFNVEIAHGATTKPFTVGDVTYRNFPDACRDYDLKPATVRKRLKDGWTLGQAFGIEARKVKNRPQTIEADGRVFQSKAAFAEYLKISDATVLKKEKAGWSHQQIFDHYATRSVADRNSVTVLGMTFKPKAAAAKHFGLSRSVVTRRKELNWSEEDIYLTPSGEPKNTRQ